MTEPWYETNFFGVLLGAIITIGTFIISQIIISSNEKKRHKQSIVILITQSNATLFSIIYEGSINKEKINYIDLRHQLEKSNVLFVLPNKLRTPFEELYKIHIMDDNYYRENKKRIHTLLIEIVNELKSYGVDFD